MARKPAKSTKKRTPARPRSRGKGSRGPELPDLRKSVLRAEVIGVSLLLVAIFTLLSLLTSSRGQLTDSWIDLLRSYFGLGAWGIPFVAGILGLWLIIRALEQLPNMPWQRPVGIGVLFVAFVIGAALVLPAEVRGPLSLRGDGGGLFGWSVADGLEATVGGPGAWVFVALLVVAGLFALTDRLLIELGLHLSDSLANRPAPAEPPIGPAPRIAPALPMPSGQVPWWKRSALLSRFIRPRQDATPATPFALPPVPQRSTPATATVVGGEPAPPRSQGAPAPARPSPTPAGDAGLPPPRIVGGATIATLPDMATILTDYNRYSDSDESVRTQGKKIEETLATLGVPVSFVGWDVGPSITQFHIVPGFIERNVRGEVLRTKVKVSKIAAHANDLALALAAQSVRIEAPVPGTPYVGVEVPNRASNVVGLKDLMESEAFQQKSGALRLALGEDVKGNAVVSDMVKMPHLLIAGATGSGKSVCINSIIACLLLTQTPDNLRLLMIDPKMVELSVYNGVPHLLTPVVTEVDKAAQVLFWAVKEMERRYTLFSKVNARDLPRYNEYLRKNGEKPLPYIVVIVDEMADLMMAAPEEVEKHICRLAQMARAVGLHLIIATQRPSVDVITGLIKANFPARIAFAVTSQIDSRVILDIPGAERLLGRGDMLFMAPDSSKLERIQGTFLSDDEINRLVRYWKGFRSLEGAAAVTEEAVDLDGAAALAEAAGQPPSFRPAASQEPLSQPPLFEQIEQMRAAEARDNLFDEAVKIVQENGRGSVNLLQRRLRIGYSRAARLVDQLEEAGVLGPDLGAGRGREYLPSPAAAPGARPDFPHTIEHDEYDDEFADDPPNPNKPSQIWF